MDYSIIIPAFDEQVLIPKTLRHLREAMLALPGRGEIVVVDNNSNDRTAEIAHQEGARIIFEPHNQISKARNAGARAALGKYLIFLDADTLVPRSTLESALRSLRTNRVVGGGAVLRLDRELRASVRTLVLSWNWLSTTFGLAAGSFLFCRRDAWHQTGGFSEHVYAGEEVLFSRALKRWGRKRQLRFRVLDLDPVITSARKLQWYGAPQLLWKLALPLCFPFAVRYRSLCSFWYRRPAARLPEAA
ncbi:MAG: glycosyltransferase [Verrucomicrobiales bacterium]